MFSECGCINKIFFYELRKNKHKIIAVWFSKQMGNDVMNLIQVNTYMITTKYPKTIIIK